MTSLDISNVTERHLAGTEVIFSCQYGKNMKMKTETLYVPGFEDRLLKKRVLFG